MKKRDIVLIVVLLAVSAASAVPGLFRKSGNTAYLYAEGRLYGTYSLSQPCDIHLVSRNGIVNDIRIENGCAYMKNATCPGKLCMNCRISRNGESFCCAPSGVFMVIRQEDSGYDAITK